MPDRAAAHGSSWTATRDTTTRSPCCSPPAARTVDLLAVTTVAGNQTLDKVTRNALAVATVGGVQDVPVAAGAAPAAGP